ncbi:cation transporter, partial [Nocardia puris]|uniref:cation transporter n=1 Tax=Nocardia puris TaxID=208602 RepID=UPI003F697A4E
MVTTASVTLALTLIALKLAASITTNSVSMLASLIDSTMDLLASLVTLVAVRIALQPPDEDHRGQEVRHPLGRDVVGAQHHDRAVVGIGLHHQLRLRPER